MIAATRDRSWSATWVGTSKSAKASSKRAASASTTWATLSSSASLDMSASLRTASSPKIASSSRWATTADPPAIPASAPESPPVWTKTSIMRATETPLTPRAMNLARERLFIPSPATSSMTSPCQSRMTRSTRSSKSGCTRPSWSEEYCRTARPAGEESHAPTARSAAASVSERTSAARPDSTATLTLSASGGVPRIAPTTRSRNHDTFSSMARMN